MIQVKIEDSWLDILRKEFDSEYFKNLITYLKSEKTKGKIIYPPGSLLFNAFNSTPFHEVKVVILGQDPYHGPGEAMGLCFSVPKNIPVPPSLKNIYKEINRDLGFPIPTHGDLSCWAQQGVLLLNASLTVEHKLPNSHKNIGWHTFTDQVISRISEHCEHIVFLLWGNFARSKKNLISSTKHLILESPHPSPLAGGGFIGNAHFSKCNDYLRVHDRKTINWQII
jgi:uracil-DNA glycosylase